MVLLKKIRKMVSVIECDIYPEDSAYPGHIKVEIETKRIFDVTLPEGYEWCINHVNHAGGQLLACIERNNIPSEIKIMWY